MLRVWVYKKTPHNQAFRESEAMTAQEQKSSCWLYVLHNLPTRLVWPTFATNHGVLYHTFTFTSTKNHQWCWAITMMRPFHGFRLKLRRGLSSAEASHWPLLQRWASCSLWTKPPPIHDPASCSDPKKLRTKVSRVELGKNYINHMLRATYTCRKGGVLEQHWSEQEVETGKICVLSLKVSAVGTPALRHSQSC